jgi:hypothetical protein
MKSFTIQSESMVISDPIYPKSIWCSATVDNVMNGTWNVLAIKTNDIPNRGVRIKELIVMHESHKEVPEFIHTLHDEFGVDGASFGFFDEKHYQNAESLKGVELISREPDSVTDLWHLYCRDRAFCEEDYGVLPYGVVSTSGLGDGCYPVYYHTSVVKDLNSQTQKEMFSAFKVVFITDSKLETLNNKQSDE